MRAAEVGTLWRKRIVLNPASLRRACTAALLQSQFRLKSDVQQKPAQALLSGLKKSHIIMRHADAFHHRRLPNLDSSLKSSPAPICKILLPFPGRQKHLLKRLEAPYFLFFGKIRRVRQSSSQNFIRRTDLESLFKVSVPEWLNGDKIPEYSLQLRILLCNSFHRDLISFVVLCLFSCSWNECIIPEMI